KKTWKGPAWLPSCRIVHKSMREGFSRVWRSLCGTAVPGCASTEDATMDKTRPAEQKPSSDHENGSRIIRMFERYTESARRAIFFARYEASQLGSPYIETRHLLLGIMREDKTLTCVWLTNERAENIRLAIESAGNSQKRVSTSVDLPLSSKCKQALTSAAEQADSRSDRYISTGHLLLGLLSQ